MKKRTAFIGAILSLIPLGQPIFFETVSFLTSAAVIYSLSANAESQNAEFFFKRGNDKLDNGDPKDAISDYTQAIKLDPDFGDAYYKRANAKDVLKDFKGAIKDYTKAIKIIK